MKPAPFQYHAPASVAEALDLLAEGGDVKVLAGGQSLVPAMNFRVAQPSVLIDLNPIGSLSYIRPLDDGGVRVGAMTRQAAVEHSDLVAERVPLLAEAMPLIAHSQIRNRGTVGGSMVHADPAAELPVVAVALGASFRIQGPSGERVVPASEFFQGMFTTAVGPDELLVDVDFPAAEAGSAYSFQEVSRRPGDYAMAGIAAVVTLDGEDRCSSARLVYLNLGDGPVEAPEAAALLAGEARSEELFEEVGQRASADELFPFGNVHASPEYQTHLARVLTVRGLKTAWERALEA